MRKFNVVVLGAGGVGKSALTVRFIRDEFIENYDPTIEEEYRRTICVDGVTSELEVLDTAGVEQFTNMHEAYIRSGHGFVLVFSLTQEASLRDVDHMRQQIYQIKGSMTGTPIVVVGTKLDLTNEREVSAGIMQDLAMAWDLPFYETSAKRGWFVLEVFTDLVRQMCEHYPAGARIERKQRKRSSRGCVVM